MAAPFLIVLDAASELKKTRWENSPKSDPEKNRTRTKVAQEVGLIGRSVRLKVNEKPVEISPRVVRKDREPTPASKTDRTAKKEEEKSTQNLGEITVKCRKRIWQRLRKGYGKFATS